MSRIVDYFFASRPMLILPVWSIYLVSLHYHHELADKEISSGNLAVLSGLTLLSAGAYYVNQIFDRVTDRSNQKVLFLQNRLVNEKTLMTLFILFSVITIAFAAFYSKVIFFIFLQLFGLGFIYSAPPLRLKDRPISGLLVNAFAFGLLVPISIMPEITQHNAGLLGWDNPFYFFLSVIGVHILTTLPDIFGDKETSKKTVGVVFPKKIAMLLSFFAFAGAAFVAFQSGFIFLIIIGGVAAGVTLAALINPVDKLVLLTAKLPILLLTLLAGYFYPVYLLFVVVLILATRAYYQRRFNITYPKLA